MDKQRKIKRKDRSFSSLMNLLPDSYGEILKQIGSGNAINEYSEGTWKFLKDLQVNEDNALSLFGLGLKYKFEIIISKYISFLRERKDVFLDVNQFKKLCINYTSGGDIISIEEFGDDLIDPLFELLEKYAASSKKNHEISINVSGNAVEIRQLKKFLLSYNANIVDLTLVNFHKFGPDYFEYVLLNCGSLRSIEIDCHRNLTSKFLEKINCLTRLEKFSIRRTRRLEFLEFTHMEYLTSLLVDRMDKLKEINLEHLHNLRRIDISQCVSLEKISMIDLPQLEELIVQQSHLVKFTDSLREFTNLKICIINDRKHL